MRQGQEHFLRPDLQLPDRVLDGGVTAGEPVLVPQPLPDAVGGVALLLGGRRVVGEDLTDEGQDRLDRRSAAGLTPSVPGGSSWARIFLRVAQ